MEFGGPRTSGVRVLMVHAAALSVLLAGCGSGSTAATEPPASTPASATTPGPGSSTELRPGRVDAPCQQPEDVALTTDDIEARALVLGSGSTGVILAHGQGRDLCELDAFGRELAQQGYRVLLADVNGADPLGELTRDAAWLRANGVSQVGLVGVSTGGTFVLALTPTVSAAFTVAVSAPEQAGTVRAVPAMASVTTPVMLMAGEGDASSVASAKKLAGALTAPGLTKKVQLVEGSSGGSALLSVTSTKTPVLSFIGDELPAS